MSYREPYNPFGGGFTYMPPVIKNLLIINVAIFIITDILAIREVRNYILMLFALWGVDTPYFWPWQLVSYMFLHGGFMHILFNMFGLWMFGVELENYWGSKRFLSFYLITGVGAGVIQLIVQGLSGSGAPTVGASGAVYGVLLAFGMMFPNRIIFFSFLIPIQAKYFVILYGAIELISGLTRSGSNVAHFAHLGGMLFGFFLIKYWQKGGDFSRWWKRFIASVNQPSDAPKKGPTPIYNMPGTGKPDTASSAGPAKTDAQRLDDILDKIAEGGYAALTAEEKDFLFTYSRKR